MRETSTNAFPNIAPGAGLVARGGALKTFGGLALLLVVALLVLGAARVAVARLIRGCSSTLKCHGHVVRVDSTTEEILRKRSPRRHASTGYGRGERATWQARP